MLLPGAEQQTTAALELLANHDIAWLAGLLVALLVTGVVAGILAGLLGVGGGIVIVPVLFHMFTLLGIDPGVKMHLAVGTSLATIVPTSIISARAHARRGSLDRTLLRALGPALLVGVLIGSLLSGLLRGTVLTAVFACVALLVAAHMALARQGMTVADGLPPAPFRQLLGAVIGTLSTLMGTGGGTLSVPILSALNYPIHRAVGTAAAIGVLISIPGAIALLIAGLGVPMRPPGSIGYVNLFGVALIVPMTMFTAPWGARLAHATDARRLKQLFALFLFLTALRMFYGLL